MNGELTRKLYLTIGLKQGCNLSPLFFTLMMQDMARCLGEAMEGMFIGSLCISALNFADELCLVSTTNDGLQKLLNIVETEGSKFNMKINETKTKVVNLHQDECEPVYVNNIGVETALEYKYLGRNCGKLANFLGDS